MATHKTSETIEQKATKVLPEETPNIHIVISRKNTQDIQRIMNQINRLIGNINKTNNKIPSPSLPCRMTFPEYEIALSVDNASRNVIVDVAGVSQEGISPYACITDVKVMKDQDSLLQIASRAFERELPQLLRDHFEKWVAFRGDEQVGISNDKFELYKELSRKNIGREEVLIERILPQEEELHI